MPRPLRTARTALAPAIGLTVLAGFSFATTDAVGKELSAVTSIWQAAWARYTVQALLVIALLARRGGAGLPRTRRPLTQLARSFALLATTLLMYASVTRVPLANATAIQFLAPLLVVIWAAVFLGERIRARHICAVAMGFAGAVITIGPQVERSLSPEVLLPLGVAVCMSIFLVLTRLLSAPEERNCTQFASTAVGALVLSLVMPFVWVAPDAAGLILMAMIGGIATLGHWGLVIAFSLAPASTLTPFLYSQVLSATLISVFWFRDALSVSLLVGASILIASGIFLWWRERAAAAD